VTVSERLIFDCAHLRATIFNEEAPKLLVTFRQRIGEPGAFDEARPVRSFLRKNYAHLHLQSRLNDWYVNADTVALEAALVPLAAEFRRVVATGFSMGGYGVLRFSKTLGIQHALLVSPQFSISPDVVPWDRRYRRDAGAFDPEVGDVASRAKRGMKGVILADPFRPMDIRHAGLIQAAFPKLHLCRLGCGGHPATRALGETGGFSRVQNLLRSGQIDPREITDMHRAARRDSATYWRHLSENAEKRGHGDLAEKAMARHRAFG